MNPLLLLHGALGSKSQFDSLKSSLETKGFVVYSMNFSGHSGEPFRDNFGIETFSDDIIKFLDEKNISQTDIFGFSMGGYVAVWSAFKNPHRIGKIVTLGTKFDWYPATAEKEIRKLSPEKIIEKVPAFARILEQRHSPHDWKEVIAKTSKMMKGLGVKPLITEENIIQITNEILILLGDQDDMADMNYSVQVAELLPHGNFLLLGSTQHSIEKVNSEMLTRIITNHLINSKKP